MLTQVPYDILLDIALQVALVDHGPPTHLRALLATCKSIHDALNSNAFFYANIFRAKFDVRAVARRLPRGSDGVDALAGQLPVYCTALGRIHRRDFAQETIQGDLWSALFMMFENDGRNELELTWADLKGYADTFVRTRLLQDSEHMHGWPAESPVNALALWLMWFTTTEADLVGEAADARRQLMELVRPYVVLPVRYPIYHAPDRHYRFPLEPEETAPSTQTPHGTYPPYRVPELLQYEVVHYGVKLTVAAPLIATAARLLYFARSEATPFVIPTELPVDRAAALEQDMPDIMPTQEDYIRFNQHKAAAVVPRGPLASSARWDEDWERVRWCFDPRTLSPRKGSTYAHGSIEGDWMGRMLLPDPTEYFDMVQTAAFAQHRPLMSTVPISLRLREYHAVSPTTVFRTGSTSANPHDHGIMNAWLPHTTDLVEYRGHLRILDRKLHVTTYERWQSDQPNSHDSSKCLMCIERRQRWEEQREGREERTRTTQRLAEKKRKSASDSDDEDDDEDDRMGSEESDEESDREGRARGKRQRRGRGPSARREESGSPEPTEAVPFDASGMEQVDEVEEVRRQWQHVMGSSSQVDEVLDAEMLDSDEDQTCTGVQDIIVIGETLPKPGQAWHHYRFYGRVRTWDGLIVMVRVPYSMPELGTNIFRGYLIGNQNFVGNWRTLNVHPLAIPLEGPFIASRAPNAE